MFLIKSLVNIASYYLYTPSERNQNEKEDTEIKENIKDGLKNQIQDKTNDIFKDNIKCELKEKIEEETNQLLLNKININNEIETKSNSSFLIEEKNSESDEEVPEIIEETNELFNKKETEIVEEPSEFFQKTKEVNMFIKLLEKLNLTEYINIPRICSIGNQSNGKTSILTNIIGLLLIIHLNLLNM